MIARWSGVNALLVTRTGDFCSRERLLGRRCMRPSGRGRSVGRRARERPRLVRRPTRVFVAVVASSVAFTNSMKQLRKRWPTEARPRAGRSLSVLQTAQRSRHGVTDAHTVFSARARRSRALRSATTCRGRRRRSGRAVTGPRGRPGRANGPRGAPPFEHDPDALDRSILDMQR